MERVETYESYATPLPLPSPRSPIDYEECASGCSKISIPAISGNATLTAVSAHHKRTSQFRDHLRRLAVVILSAMSRTWIPFVLIGALNRLAPTFVSVFFCYAGDARYADHYSYPWCRRFLLWFPSTIGIFRQGGRWGLICAAPVIEAEFTDPKNALALGRLLQRMLRVKMLLGVDQLSFAGIYPTYCTVGMLSPKLRWKGPHSRGGSTGCSRGEEETLQ